MRQQPLQVTWPVDDVPATPGRLYAVESVDRNLVGSGHWKESPRFRKKKNVCRSTEPWDLRLRYTVRCGDGVDRPVPAWIGDALADGHWARQGDEFIWDDCFGGDGLKTLGEAYRAMGAFFALRACLQHFECHQLGAGVKPVDAVRVVRAGGRRPRPRGYLHCRREGEVLETPEGVMVGGRISADDKSLFGFHLLQPGYETIYDGGRSSDTMRQYFNKWARARGLKGAKVSITTLEDGNLLVRRLR